jgi:chemotaxis protein CheZ
MRDLVIKAPGRAATPATGDPVLAKLESLCRRYPAADPEMVAEILRAILTTMRGDLSVKETSILGEVEELALTVANARAEIAALQADDITASHIPSATDELDAIVAHTAVATNTILEACETLDRLASSLDDATNRTLQEVTTSIYEACSFQDITGQRITKVVTTLQSIERKVAHIIDVFKRDDLGNPPPRPVEEAASLLNGPQLPTNAMDQSDIDALLASFD